MRLDGARRHSLTPSTMPTSTPSPATSRPRAVSARIGLACLEAMSAGLAAVDTACTLTGSASIRPDSILDRMRRDLATARTHVMFSSRLAVALGCQLAGRHGRLSLPAGLNGRLTRPATQNHPSGPTRDQPERRGLRDSTTTSRRAPLHTNDRRATVSPFLGPTEARK